MQNNIIAPSFSSFSQGVFVGQQDNNTLIARFNAWCAAQESNRFIWLAIGFMGNIGMVLPLTVLALVVAGGNNFPLLMLTCIANVPVLALNLAAQSTRITLPVLFFAWLVDAIVIAYSVVVFFTA